MATKQDDPSKQDGVVDPKVAEGGEDGWDEARLEEGMKMLKEMHIQVGLSWVFVMGFVMGTLYVICLHTFNLQPQLNNNLPLPLTLSLSPSSSSSSSYLKH